METLGLAFSMDKSLLPAINRAFVHLDDFVHALLRQRRADPHQRHEADLLDLLIDSAEVAGISERQLADMLIFLFVAGYDTSKNVLTYMMRLMMDHPDIYERCATDLGYCRDVVEESLRMFSPTTIFRSTLEDIVYRDVLIPKGTMLFFALSVSGQDPTAFERADSFDPGRSTGSCRHVAFGLGKHICLGQFVARVQLEEGIHYIAQRMKEPRPAGESGWRPFPGLWGIKGLPIAFDAAPASNSRSFERR
jgi:cytochrome P450